MSFKSKGSYPPLSHMHTLSKTSTRLLAAMLLCCLFFSVWCWRTCCLNNINMFFLICHGHIAIKKEGRIAVNKNFSKLVMARHCKEWLALSDSDKWRYTEKAEDLKDDKEAQLAKKKTEACRSHELCRPCTAVVYICT